MTKKFWLIALIVACTVVFGSCDKSEELSVEQCKLDMNLFYQPILLMMRGAVC